MPPDVSKSMGALPALAAPFASEIARLYTHTTRPPQPLRDNLRERMALEHNRLLSFSSVSWPASWPNVQWLAEAGFFFDPIPEDPWRCVSFCCNTRLPLPTAQPYDHKLQAWREHFQMNGTRLFVPHAHTRTHASAPRYVLLRSALLSRLCRHVLVGARTTRSREPAAAHRIFEADARHARANH